MIFDISREKQPFSSNSFSEVLLALHPDGSLPVGIHPGPGKGRRKGEDGDNLAHKPAREGNQQGHNSHSSLNNLLIQGGLSLSKPWLG